MHSQLRNKELNNQLKSKVMYTIDKEYLKALKKRINGERETLINESCNDNEETLEKRMMLVSYVLNVLRETFRMSLVIWFCWKWQKRLRMIVRSR